MHRVSPFTYLAGVCGSRRHRRGLPDSTDEALHPQGLLTSALGNARVQCSNSELLRFSAPSDSTCGEYMAEYRASAGGYLVDPSATECEFCPTEYTNDFLRTFSYNYGNRWRGTSRMTHLVDLPSLIFPLH